MKAIEPPDHPRGVILPGIQARPLHAHKIMPPARPGIPQCLDLGELLGDRLAAFAARFWDRVDVRDDHPCWHYTGRISEKSGYGLVRVRITGHTKVLQAHRVARALAGGVTIPEGVLVRHSCGTRPCCNPAHLWLGDYSGNVVVLGAVS